MLDRACVKAASRLKTTSVQIRFLTNSLPARFRKGLARIVIAAFTNADTPLLVTLTAALARAGALPLVAGIATGAAAFVVVDEAVMSALFPPPPRAYLLESHMRGIVGHLAYGTAAGTMLAAARGLGTIGR
jgi:hypothetical protein